MYYPCAFGKIGRGLGLEHASIYIGGGASVHLYSDNSRARLICTSAYASSTYLCEMLILDPDENTGFSPRIEIIERAVNAFCKQHPKKLKGLYAGTTNNCHQWVFDIAKVGGKVSQTHALTANLGCYMPIKRHTVESKSLAIRRIEEEKKMSIDFFLEM